MCKGVHFFLVSSLLFSSANLGQEREAVCLAADSPEKVESEVVSRYQECLNVDNPAECFANRCFASRDPVDCANAGIALWGGGQREAAGRAWEISCDDGDGCLQACNNLAITADNETESMVRYAQACREGQEERFRDSCTALGTLEYREAMRLFSSREPVGGGNFFQRAIKHTEEGCAEGQGDIDGCVFRGRIDSDHGREEESLKWFRFGCTDTENRGCLQLGITLHKLKKSEEAIGPLERACADKGIEDFACFHYRLVASLLGQQI